MASINIEDLFDNDRFPGGLPGLLLFLYSPLGLCLVILRFFIGIQTVILAWILPKYSTFRLYVLRVMCAVLGVMVTRDDWGLREQKARVLVSNYTSALDHLAISLVQPNVLPSVWDLPIALMKFLGYVDMGAKQGRETLIHNAKKHCRDSAVPLLAFPEGAFTNGRVGLLKFSIWPFSLEQPVQPLILTLKRPPMARLAPSVLGGRWWIDIFWFLFVPYTCYHIRVLRVEEEQDEETTEEFTIRVQKTMAEKMGLCPTNYTSADKVDYAKRKFVIAPLGGSPGTESDVDSPLEMMVRQVQEVLPHIPPDAIRDDLALTKDVDLTLTNILEGRVQFTPIEPGTQATPSSLLHTSFSSVPNSQVNTKTPPATSSKSFGKNHKERHMSFEERKKALLDYARHRYFEKHSTK